MKEVIVPADDLVCLGKDKLQELIRCKDCKNNPSSAVDWISCPMTGAGTRKPNDFCSYAERKEE